MDLGSAGPSVLGIGTVTLLSWAGSTDSGTVASASFVGAPYDDCTTTTISTSASDCEATACIVSANPFGDGGHLEPGQASAGVITFGGSVASIVLTPSSVPAVYTPFTSPDRWFAGGEQVIIDVAGDEAPHTRWLPLAPTPVMMTPPPGNWFGISRASDFTISWSGGTVGGVGLTIESGQALTEPGTAYGKVTCYFPVGYGHGTVSTDALAALPAGASTVTIDVESEGIEWDPNWRTTARVATYAETPTGDSYRGGTALVE
jgi:hypothetical protein